MKTAHIKPSHADATWNSRPRERTEGNQGLTGQFPNMDRETILRELAQIEDRVARTQRQIASYRETVSRLEEDGRDAGWAKLMLRQCEEVLALHLTVHAKLIDRLSRSAN